MTIERVHWRIAVGCAALLFCAPMTLRTSWTSLPQSESGPGGTITHSAGWDWIALLLGIVALVSLIVGRWQRPGVGGAVVSAMSASISLAGAGAAALGHWLDLLSGSLGEARWVIHPAPAVGYVAAIAIVGMVAALVLLGSWLHPGAAAAWERMPQELLVPAWRRRVRRRFGGCGTRGGADGGGEPDQRHSGVPQF